jgi:tetratricopeptide (TPR) repeat protein
MNIHMLFQEAEAKRAEQKLQEAISLYRTVLVSENKHIGARCGLSMCYRAIGDLQSAEDLLEQGLKLPVSSYWFLIERALLEQQRDQIEESLRLCDEAITLEPSTGAGYIWKHTFLQSLGRESDLFTNREAAKLNVESFNEIQSHFIIRSNRIVAEGVNDLTSVEIASKLRSQGLVNEAIDCLEKRFLDCPTDIVNCVQLIETLCATQKVEEAKTALREALKRNPNNEWLLLEEPRIFEASGSVEIAQQLDSQLSKRFSLNPLPLIRMAERTLSQRRLVEAKDFAQRALKVDEKNFWALLLSARIYKESGDHYQAINHAEMAVRYHPKESVGYLLLSDLTKGCGDISGSINYLLTGLRSVQDNKEMLTAVVRSLIEVHDYDAALLIVEEYSYEFRDIYASRPDVSLDILQLGARCSPTAENHTRLVTLLVKVGDQTCKLELSIYLLVAQTLLDTIRVPAGSDVWPLWNEQEIVLERTCQTAGAFLARVIASAGTHFPHLNHEIQKRLRRYIVPILKRVLADGSASKETIVLLIFYRKYFSPSETIEFALKFKHLFAHLSVQDWIAALHETHIQSNKPDKKLSDMLEDPRGALGLRGTSESIHIKMILSSAVATNVREKILALAQEEFSSSSFQSELEVSETARVNGTKKLVTLYLASRSEVTNVPRKLMRDLATAMPLALRRKRLHSVLKNKRSCNLPKVAFCVSGQVRALAGINKNWTEELFPGCEPHVFLHVWDKVQPKTPFHFQFSSVFSPEVCHVLRSFWFVDQGVKIWNSYPCLFRHISSPQPIPEREKLAQLFCTQPQNIAIDEESKNAFSGWDNQRKMAYKIRAAHNLMTSTCEDFDLVVRMRPDVLFQVEPVFSWKNCLEMLRDGLKIGMLSNTQILNGFFSSDDTFAIGSPEMIGLYAHYSTIREAMISAGVLWESEMCGHLDIGHMMWFYGVEGIVIPGLRMSVSRNVDPIAPKLLRDIILEDAKERMNDIDYSVLQAIDRDLDLNPEV